MPITRLEVDFNQAKSPRTSAFRPKVENVGDSGGGSGQAALLARRRQAADAYQSGKQSVRERPSVLASAVMSAELRTLGFQMPVKQARLLQAETGFGHFPIVDQSGMLLGLVSDRDLLRGYNASDPTQTSAQVVGQLMSRQIITATEDTEVRELARVMVDEGFHCVPICSPERKLVGMVTSTDILRAVVMHGTLSGWI